MTNAELQFDIFRKAYPGSKRGLEVEYEQFIYACRKKTIFSRVNYRTEIDKLLPALQAETVEKKAQRADPFKQCPDWKNMETWLNKRCWTRDIPEKPKPKPKPPPEPVKTPYTEEERKAIMANVPWKR